jgi:DNA-directed RNA polymerase subunit RPC12/RpoP
MNNPAAINKYTCSNCGADLAFNPIQGVLKCDYCGHEEVISQTKEQPQERSYQAYVNNSKVRLEKLSATAVEVNCADCGANITFEPPKVAGSCPFCAAKIVAQPKIADPTIAPEGIVPFSLGRQDARKNLQKWMKDLWFAPNDLKQLAQPEKIQGVYLPFWTYDTQTVSSYSGQRGDYYYVTENYTEKNDNGEEVTKTRQVKHTRWTSVSGMVNGSFDDVLVPATKLVDVGNLKALEPWNLKESLRAYEPSYLAGFEAQRSQLTLEEGLAEAKKTIDNEINYSVKRDIGGDEQEVYNVSTDYQKITFKHILLPVWLASYRYKQRQFQVLINAQTGEVQGERPYSPMKIFLAVLGGVFVIAIIILIIFWLSK